MFVSHLVPSAFVKPGQFLLTFRHAEQMALSTAWLSVGVVTINDIMKISNCNPRTSVTYIHATQDGCAAELDALC